MVLMTIFHNNGIKESKNFKVCMGDIQKEKWFLYELKVMIQSGLDF